jgi:hypothetical protein
MENTKSMLLAVFLDRVQADDAINALASEGYRPHDISVIMRDKVEREKLVDNTGAHVAESAVSGVATGGALGGLAGLLIGVGAIAVPGIGALLIGGPLAAALGLSGVAATTVSGAATGALAGGVVGALVGLGVPPDVAKVYEDQVREGAILLAIPVHLERNAEVNAILTRYGATQVREVMVS